MSAEGASYRAAGVDYEALDAGKRLAMLGALSTSPLLAARGGRALDASRGEPAFVFELGERTFAFVRRGARARSRSSPAHVLERQGINRFADVAYDTVAAILNDLCCVGALPLVVNAYFATGGSGWYEHRERAPRCVEGWRAGLRGRGLRVGRGGVALAARGCSTRRRSSSPAPRSASSPRARSPILGGELARAMRSCSSPPAACTPTAPRWRGWSPRGCPRAMRPCCPTAARFGRGAARPVA